jgi:hypothetical protein
LKEYGADYKYILVFLTPEGLDPSDSANWVAMSYDTIAEILKEIVNKNNTLSYRTKIYLEDYVNTIRRYIVEDKELLKCCNDIYGQNREFFDIMFSCTKGTDKIKEKVSSYIYNYIKDNKDKYGVELWSNKSSNWIKFTPVALQNLYGTLGQVGYNSNRNLIMFDLEFYDDKVMIKIIVEPVLDSKDESIKQSIIDRARKANWDVTDKKDKNGQIKDSKEKTIKSDVIIAKAKWAVIKENIANGKEDVESACKVIVDKEFESLAFGLYVII